MRNKGFTLVETIVVITIFSIIATGIASSFMSGMKIWGRARNVEFAQSQALFSLEQIAIRLRQSLNISAIGFSGTDEDFSFPGIMAGDIGRIKYRFDPAREAVFLRFQSLGDILLAQEQDEDAGEVEYKEQKFLPVKSFSVSYFYRDEEGQFSWSEEWAAEAGIFEAVKIEVDTGQDRVEKVIFVPIAGSGGQEG